MTSASSRYDVIVAGVGGMGSATAYHLALLGARVQVLQCRRRDHGRPGRAWRDAARHRHVPAVPSAIPEVVPLTLRWGEIAGSQTLFGNQKTRKRADHS